MYYILEPESGEIFSYDATEGFSFKQAGTLTKYTIEEGAIVSDHYTLENKEISTSGLISDWKSPSAVNSLSTEDFMSNLDALIRKKKPFRFYYRSASSRGDVYFKDLFITNLEYSQDNSTGYVNGKYAYKVSMSLSQVQYADRATVTSEYLPNLKSDKGQEKKPSNANTQKPPSTLDKNNIKTSNKPKPGSNEHYIYWQAQGRLE